jgi:hypothetical protein
MGKVNRNRVILGGLLAGVIIDASEAFINAVVLRQDWADVMSKLGKSPDLSAAVLVGFNVIGFITGILMVWMYAAIRSRYGAGPKTALMVAFTIWVIGYAIPTAGEVGIGLIPAQLAATAVGLGLMEVILAALAGSSVYKEEAGQTPVAMSAAAR